MEMDTWWPSVQRGAAQHLVVVILVLSGSVCSLDAVVVLLPCFSSPACCWQSDFSHVSECECNDLGTVWSYRCWSVVWHLSHWQNWEESPRLILQTHFSGEERDWSIFRSAKCSQHSAEAWCAWSPESHSRGRNDYKPVGSNQFSCHGDKTFSNNYLKIQLWKMYFLYV